jgi:hypothetical protein
VDAQVFMGPKAVVSQSFGKDIHPVFSDDQVHFAVFAGQGMDGLEDLVKPGPTKIDPFVNRIEDPQRRPPTGFIQGLILLLRFSPACLPFEGGPDIMPHVRVQKTQASESGLLGPAGVVVVLEVSRAVSFVQDSDLLDHLPFDQQAASGAMVQFHPFPAALDPGAGIGLQVLRHGLPGVMILLGVQEAGFGMGLGELHHPLQPPFGDHNVIVQNAHVGSQRGSEPLVHGPDESQVFFVPDQDSVPGRISGQTGQEGLRIFFAPVVDQDQTIGSPGVPADRFETPPGQGRLVPYGDDDVANRSGHENKGPMRSCRA